MNDLQDNCIIFYVFFFFFGLSIARYMQARLQCMFFDCLFMLKKFIFVWGKAYWSHTSTTQALLKVS